jgi:hypothetical protein
LCRRWRRKIYKGIRIKPRKQHLGTKGAYSHCAFGDLMAGRFKTEEGRAQWGRCASAALKKLHGVEGPASCRLTKVDNRFELCDASSVVPKGGLAVARGGGLP